MYTINFLYQRTPIKSFVIICAVVFLLFSCKKKPEEIRPVVQDITESVYASGIIKSKNQYQVFATVNGLVQQIFVTEGDTVKKGDAIIKVLNETSQLNTENARLSAQYAEPGANTEKLNELNLIIEVARSKMMNDSLLLHRQRNLWNEGIGSRNELEQRELALKNSISAYRSSILRLSDLEKQLNFSSNQSKKNLQISTTIARDYTIKSEVNGRVYSLLKEKGEMVNTQSPVAIIGDANNFVIELQVDEYDIAKIRIGQKIVLNMDSYKGEIFEAVVEKVNPIMNERTRAFTIDAAFTKRPELLYPNLSAEANIIIQTKAKALTIPRSYLIDDGFVLMPNNEKKAVVTGLKDYQLVEIIKGLSAADLILKPTK